MHTPTIHYKRIIQSIFANHQGWQNDLLVRDNRTFLKGFSETLMARFSLPKMNLYRGLLLPENKSAGEKLRPIRNRYYTSFSSCRDIALEFADPSHELSFLLAMNGNTKGFLVEHQPNDDEILYHWCWGAILNFYEGNFRPFYSQKEVILFQNGQNFILNSPL